MRQMGIFKEKSLEESKELEEGSDPLSSRGDGNSDSEEAEEESEEDCEEEPEEDLDMEVEESSEGQTEDELAEGSEVESDDDQEEDPEEEPQEDPVEEPEEDLETELEENPEEQTEGELVEGSEVDLEDEQEEDSSEDRDEKSAVECATTSKSYDVIVSTEQKSEYEDKDPSADCMFESNPKRVTEPAYQNASTGKQRILVNAKIKASLSQNYGIENNCENDEAVKQAQTSQHSVQGLEAVDTSPGQQANFGKRRRSRWDQDREDDKKTIVEDGNGKKRKSRWDADESKLRSQEPQIDLEVQALKSRFSEISCILHPREETNVGRGLRKKLMKEYKKILSMLEKRNAIFYKELYVPVKEYPTYNFFGIIIGPKGNTQKRMEMETGAKIRLRGKGSLKTLKGVDTSEDTDLRVYIEASSQKSLDAAVCMVEKLLIPVEEGMNDHKRAQLQELSNLKAAGIINSCSVCKETGHNQFACPQKRSTLEAACDTCGSFSHPTSGCPVTPLKMKIQSSREMSAAKLYVGALPQTIDDSRLRELFSPFGTITESKVIIDLRTGKSKGYGFVGFDTPSAASLGIMHMNGYQMDGHSLIVQKAGTPVYPIRRPVAVGTSSPALPHYMLPEAQVSVRSGEGPGFPLSLNLEHKNQFLQTVAQVSSGSRTAYSSTGFVSMSTESRSAVSSTNFVSQFPGNPDYPGLVSGSTESRTGYPSAGLGSIFTESRSVFPSTSYVSRFPGDPDYPGLVSGSSESRTSFLTAGFVSGSESTSAFSSASLASKFPGDPDYPSTGFQSYFQ